MEKMKCSFFDCPKGRGMRCCTSCEQEGCGDRCINDPHKCGLCDRYPRMERRMPQEEES